VSLTTTDTLGIVQIYQMDSIVRVAGPRAGFIVSQSASCTSTQVSFIDTSQNATSWEWDFGDGNTSTLSSPSHVYSSGMPNYIITQTVSDTMGCTSAISTSIYSNFVSPLLASETEICGLDTVDFYTSLQNYASYLWDFGDSTTSTQVSPKHVYAHEGVYTTTLTVTDQAGCSQTFQVNPPITVSLPEVAFTTTTGRQGCNTINIQFVNQSSNADSYLWNFGDGTISSLENPMHSYLDPGHYDVSLTIFRGNCASTLNYPEYIRVDTAHADFTMTGNSICMPYDIQFTDLSANAVSWAWNFGTGDSSNVQNPLYTFSDYTGLVMSLAIVDVNGCRDTAFSPPPSPLLADFKASLDTGCIPMVVHFDNSSLNAVHYFWDFGDGTTSTDVSPDHTYTQAGDYNVKLIVQSTPFYGSCTDTLDMQALIHAREPIAGFSTPDRYACAPSLVNFTDLSLDADSYLWDFGDSTTSTNSNPSHIYNNPGLYSVSLIVSSNAGCQDTLNMPDYIRVLGPLTNFTADVFEGCVPFQVQFTDHSHDAVEWNWSFGDGYAEYAMSPGHLFQDTGSFTVSLVTKDTAGCSSYYELPQRIIVHPSPTAAYTTSNISGCQPFTATFVNTSSGYTSSLWNFGDGGTSTDNDPNHLYLDDGIYAVQLIASNNFGCADTFTAVQPLRVLPSPNASFTAGATQGCAPFHVNFFNATTNVNGSTYLWD
ncbi:MAG TPA: PKD domain-containing protein, partial [Bacteroidia bacterium]|nr:PKD domain-containing protein [Bacteroidia bacterium]